VLYSDKISKIICPPFFFLLHFFLFLLINYIQIYVNLRVLLQRISNILTAPPTISDEDYIKMRKLVSTMKGPREIYEANLITEKNKEFYRNLKKIGPYYNPKEWEDSYQRQVITYFIRHLIFHSYLYFKLLAVWSKIYEASYI